MAAAFALAAYRPDTVFDWALENALVVCFLLGLILSYRKLPLSDVSYLCIFAYLCLHEWGAHYKYSDVPLGEWMKVWLHTQRNHYDRVAHFAFGLLCSYPIQEAFIRSARVGGAWRYYLPIEATMACSAVYEIMEAGMASILSPQRGEEFVGMQGDIWDSQEDMLMAGLGSLVAMICVYQFRKRRAAATAVREMALAGHIKKEMPATVASSALAVPHSRIRELAEIAMGMDGVLKLYFGESNIPTPDFIKRAAQKAMADGFTFYTENAGLPSLRKSLARYYAELHGVELDPATEITVTASGVQALSVGLRCMVDPGDEALVLTPSWPNGPSIIQMSHGVVKEVPQPLVGDRYIIDFEALEKAVTPRTRLLLYTSPSNPLGWVATDQDQEKLLEFTRRHGLWLMADEVYERLVYSDPPKKTVPSILTKCTREDAVVVVQSFSKAYCMTGWRVGWLVARKDFSLRASQLNEFYISHAPSFSQRAGETALLWGEDVVKAMVARLKENRDFCMAALKKMPGVKTPAPDGAFYLFPKIEGVADSFAFCKDLLMETKVGLAPGVAFGAGGEGSVRICYASEKSILEEAMARLKPFLESRR